MTHTAPFIKDGSPGLVLSEPNHLYLRILSGLFGNDAATRALREADGIEAVCQARPWALGDPEPAKRWVDQFHRSCDRRGIRLTRTLHAMDRLNPVARKRGMTLACPRATEDNARLIRAEVSLCAALRRPAGGESLLVIHPGVLYRDDMEATIRLAAGVLQRCAEHAAEHRVRLSVETEPVSEWGHCLGSDFAALSRVVGEVNEWCDARGIEPVAAITMDIEHSLIAAWGDEERLLREIEEYGHLIEYVHVVRPLDIFDSKPPPTPRPWNRRASYIYRKIYKARAANAHMTVAPPGGDPRIERIIRAAYEKTNWRRIGVFNFEALPFWYYFPRSLSRGATAAEQFAGLRRLRELTRPICGRRLGACPAAQGQ